MNRAEAIKAARKGKLIRKVSWRESGVVVAWVNGQWLVSKNVWDSQFLCDLPEGEYETAPQIEGKRYTYRILIGAEHLYD